MFFKHCDRVVDLSKSRRFLFVRDLDVGNQALSGQEDVDLEAFVPLDLLIFAKYLQRNYCQVVSVEGTEWTYPVEEFWRKKVLHADCASLDLVEVGNDFKMEHVESFDNEISNLLLRQLPSLQVVPVEDWLGFGPRFSGRNLIKSSLHLSFSTSLI